MLPFLKFPERIIVVEKASDIITPTHMTLAIKVPAGIDSWVLQFPYLHWGGVHLCGKGSQGRCYVYCLENDH